MAASGGAELLALGAVVPFLAVLSEPKQIADLPLVKSFAGWIGVSGITQLLVLVTLGFVGAAVLAATIRLVNLRLNTRLAAAVGSDLSCEAYLRTLYQPYEIHVQRNSATLITTITTYVAETVAALNAFLQLITAVVVAVGLIIGLLLIDAPVAVSLAIFFISIYGVLGMTVRRELRGNGKKIAAASAQQLKALKEGLGSIREVILDGSHSSYLRIYAEADRPQRQLSAKNTFLSISPRYLLEAVGVVAIALVGAMFVIQHGRASGVIPLLGALALGSQRLMPALQQIYSSWAVIRGFSPALEEVLEILRQPLPEQRDVAEPLLLREGIYLQDVSFQYSPEQPNVLQGINLQIQKGERIGLIGCTGSGKSTTIDILLGLLTPTSGRVMVDGLDLHDPCYPERLVAWRSAIAHVPQSIYLTDASIAENIAFGVPRHLIDFSRVKQAAIKAQIATFIESIPKSYDSFVGERGIRLSGGQRQRIGIARAIYKHAKVLVFDEATSALDSKTEADLIQALHELSSDLTIVMIAHRTTTLGGCSKIYEIKDGIAIERSAAPSS
jgi:ABC-type multidrug transport system fused ATPase/permease subunit